MRCPTCGTENREPSRVCFFCGAVLPEEPTATGPAAVAPPSAPPMMSPAWQPGPRPLGRDRSPDFVGLFGLAFFLLIIGIVFYLNQDLLTQLRNWGDQILKGRLLFRPPEGVLTSAAVFWSLIGVANFIIAGLRWWIRRSKIQTLGSTLTGIGSVSLGYLLYRYSLRDLSGSQVVSFEAAIIAILLFVYIGFGLYWSAARRRPAVAGVERAPRL